MKFFFDIIKKGLQMKNNIKTRFIKLKSFIYGEKTRERFRKNDEKHKIHLIEVERYPFMIFY